MATTFNNFQYCCRNIGTTFSVQTTQSSLVVGRAYFIELSAFSGCATLINTTVQPSGEVIFNESTYTVVEYANCSACTGATGSCFPPVPTPTPTIFYSSDTRCGNNILRRNECDPIVIFPMGVQCTGTNPSLSTIPDGALSLVISGGTPPYTVKWSTGGNGLFLTNLGVGSYSAIVIDSYGDFTAYTTCTLTAPTPVPTETRLTNTPTVTQTPTPTSDPNYPSFCLTLTIGSPSQTVNMYFTYDGSLLNNMPQYSSNNGYILYWSTDQYPNSWVMGGVLTEGNVVNYNNTVTPLNGWEFLDPNNQGNVTGILGECASYGNLCLTYSQSKQGNAVRQNTVTLFYSGMVNGQPSWQSSDGTYIMSWNSTFNRWGVNFTTNPFYYNVTNTNPAVPPISGWQQPGAQPTDYVMVYNGNCTPTTTANTNTGGGNNGTSSGPNAGCGCSNWSLTNFQQTKPTTLLNIINCDTGLSETIRAVAYGWTNFAGNSLEICSEIAPTLTEGTVFIQLLGNCCTGEPVVGGVVVNNPSSGNVPFTDAPADNSVREENPTSSANQCECVALRTITTYPGTAFYTDCSGNPAQISVPGGSGINSRACICRRVGTTVSGGVYEEPCQSVQGSSGGGTVTNNCLDILGSSCTSNVTGSSNRSTTTTAQDNGLVNNGNITLRASGGFPPYQYSIDGGLTYKSSPLFNKLGAGTYTAVIKDVSGNTYTQSVTLLSPARPDIYQVSLQTNSTTPRSGQNVTTKQLVSTISVTPSLPDGVVLLFDLVHTSNFKSSPTTTAATFNTNTLLKKNSTNYSANTVVIETGTTLNTNSGCQQKIIYNNNRTEIWTSINYINSDILSLNTSTTITKNSIDKCYIGEAIDDFILTNLRISGCTNCGVSNISV